MPTVEGDFDFVEPPSNTHTQTEEIPDSPGDRPSRPNGYGDAFNEYIWIHGSRLWNEFKAVFDGFLTENGTYNRFVEKLSQLASDHPYIALALSCLTVLVCLPFLLLVVICIASVVLVFMGFIVFEGTLITIASVLLLAILSSLLIVLTLLGSVVLAGYFSLVHILDICDTDGSLPRALAQMLGLRQNRL